MVICRKIDKKGIGSRLGYDFTRWRIQFCGKCEDR